MAKDLPRNGPSGTYSQAWMSRALQSLSRVTPKRCSAASLTGTEVPMAVAPPTTKPSSASMSRRTLGPKEGAGSDGALRCPRGRTMSVPDTTTVPARPWYPMGRCFQFGVSASPSGRKMRPTLVAWCSLA